MITTKQRSALRAMANTLKPLVIVGKAGLTDAVVDEIDLALFHNELVKIAVLKNCDSDVKLMAQEAASKLKADVVHIIGGKFVLYKFSDKEGIEHLNF